MNTERSRPTLLVVLAQVVAIVVVLAGAGVLAGVLWEHYWTPPVGQVQQGTWRLISEAGLRADFAGVALYVVIALVAGLVTGALSGLVLDRAELVSLVAVLGSSVLAGWLMWKVGVHRSPPDPQALAAGVAEGTTLPGHLRLHGRTPFISFPIGSLVGFTLVLITVSKRGAKRGSERGSGRGAGKASYAAPGAPVQPSAGGASEAAFPGPTAG